MDDKTLRESLALRAHYEQRACPPDAVLAASSEQLQAHLGYCRYCHDRLQVGAAEAAAWKDLARRMSTGHALPSRDATVGVGELWSLDVVKVGGWGPNDRYYTPPTVLILDAQDRGLTLRVAPVCGASELMADDGMDVPLPAYGFAESWNLFSVHRDALKLRMGSVDRSLAAEVLRRSGIPVPDTVLRPLIAEFRDFETEAACVVALRAMPQVMAEVETANEWLSAALGRLADVRNRVISSARGWKVSETAASIFDLLAGAQPEFLPGQAASVPAEEVVAINHVSAHQAGILVGAVTARIIEVDGEGDTFFIQGRLTESAAKPLHLVARFTNGDIARESEPYTIPAGAKAFVIVIHEVPAALCTLQNAKHIKMLVVST